MNDMLFPYLGGLIVTGIVILISMLFFYTGRKEKLKFYHERSKLPDAIKFENLLELKSRAETEYQSLAERLNERRSTVAERDAAAEWLEKNQDLLLRVKADREEQESLRMELDSLKKQVLDQQTMINKKQLEIANLLADHGYHEKIKAQLDDEIRAMEDRKNTIDADRLKLESELEPLKIRLSSIDAQIESRRDEFDQIARTLDERNQQLQCKLDQTSSLITQGEDSLNSLRQQVSDANSLLTERQAKASLAKIEIEGFDKQKLQIIAETRRREEELVALEKKGTQMSASLQPLEAKLSVIETTIIAKKEEFELLNESHSRSIEQHHEELSRLRDFIGQGERKREELNNQTASMNQKLSELRVSINALENENAILGRQKKEFQEELSRISDGVKSLSARKLQIESDLQPLEVKLAGIQTKIDRAEEEFHSLRENLEKRIQLYNLELEECKNRFDFNSTKLSEIEKRLVETNNTLHVARDERSRLSADVQALQREKVALEDLIKNLRADWNTVLQLSGRDEGAEERRTQELWQPYIKQKASEFSKRKGKSELDFLDDSNNYLRSKKLYFPQRVLRAFHTSLKVTDISPLVVLAGISGTGKSELPRRYAEAMGMHFLNVAVQPRWDSPQDMFGFFNYLENRYRATELGRALVQMDPFYKEPNRGWTPPENWDHSLSSQMLLVLLDEMNLARVEYYFSEFLSRLETRRGINRNDSESRRKAEIGLEVGSGKNKSPVMQLFVDRNVLFVGTMNEDETTQALSDKVIDRANVLRFGRPGRIGDVGSEKTISALDSKLDFSVWNSWCKSENDLPASERDRVLEAIDALDKAMAEIKRPFGFRTRNSILSYVSNYPSQDNEAISDALADQIEQKILPKFRGLDSRDSAVKGSLSKIKSVLNELNDELLISAIDQSSRDGQFVWLGVNRFEEEYNEGRG